MTEEETEITDERSIALAQEIVDADKVAAPGKKVSKLVQVSTGGVKVWLDGAYFGQMTGLSAYLVLHPEKRGLDSTIE